MAGKYSEAQKRATMKWKKSHTKIWNIRLNKKADNDIIEWFDRQANKQMAFKNLVREAIAKEQSSAMEER